MIDVTRRNFIITAGGALASLPGAANRSYAHNLQTDASRSDPPSTPAQRYTSFHPGQVWNDTEGKRIQAHGGSIIVVDGVFYWYGENKDHTVPGSKVWTWGIRCYSSTDLYNWKDMGLIIEPNTQDPSSPLFPEQLIDRPHIIYNRRTKKYVCWFKIMEKHDSNSQTRTVLTADHLLGPYTIVGTGIHPLGMNAGDFDLVVEPSDGKAYQFFERVHSEMICADLTDDYTGFTGYYSTHFPEPKPPFVREAPAHFVRKGKHYLFTSGTTGYHPNPSEVASALSIHGPWTVLGDPHPGDRSRTSYNSQITSVFEHPGKKDLYIALADRWISDLAEREGARFATGEAYADVAEAFGRMFDRDAGPPSQADLKQMSSLHLSGDTSRANYVWLPVRFEGDRPYIDWKDEWTIEEYA